MPPAVALPWLVAAAWLWRRREPPPRERAVLLTTVAIVAAATLATSWAAGPRALAAADEVEELRRVAADAWRELEDLAGGAALAMGELSLNEAGQSAAIGKLGSMLAAAGRSEDVGLLLFDPDGVPFAWAGRGLVLEPPSQAIPRQGRWSRSGFGVMSWGVAVPIGGDDRPWRVVAARSDRTDELPFGSKALRSSFGRWGFPGHGQSVPEDSLQVELSDTPVLVTEAAGADGDGGGSRPRWVWLLAGAGLLGAAGSRTVTRALQDPMVSRWPAEWMVGGLVCISMASGVRPLIAAALLGGALLGAVGLRFGGWVRSPAGAFGGGAVSVMAVTGVATWLQRELGLVDLAVPFWGGADGTSLRGAMVLAVGGSLALTGSWRRSARPVWLAGPVAALLLLISAAAVDRPEIGLPCLAASAGAIAVWVGTGQARRRIAGPSIFVVLVVTTGAVGWEAAHQRAVRNDVTNRLLPAAMGPSADEVREHSRTVNRYFDGLDLADLVVVPPSGLLADDLAFVVWSRSPLASVGVPSAVVVAREGKEPLTFSFGLPLTREGQLDIEPARWEALDLAPWRTSVRGGVAHLVSEGHVEGTLRYWFLPLPGADFGMATETDITAALLRGAPSPSTGAGTLGHGIRLARWERDGTPVVRAWSRDSSPPVSGPSRRARLVDTPEGRAWAFGAESAEGTTILYVPVLGPLEALGRAGLHSLASLIVVLCLAAAALLLAIPREPVRRRIGAGIRSYSNQLLLVYGLLLGVPLLLLNVVFLRSVEQRLFREQVTQGEAALASARQVVGERLLDLEPGFGLETALDDRQLRWISRVVHHEVNLYWGSILNASSKRELFEAGLLPGRIPGEIFGPLALEGAGLAERTVHAAGTPYLELYAPLYVPGVERGRPRLFLSVPLLAQQEEVEAEVSLMRRRALLASTVLLLAAVVAGNRLSNKFARPLQDLVEGTKRIAAGATTLDLSPAETELRELVEAVDSMAGRIAEGRMRLVREKQVVERIIEHVTAGIVSLDGAGRVVMANRVAQEMLGVRLGSELLSTLAARGDLDPVVEFLAPGLKTARETTVRLAAGVDGTTEVELRLVWVPVPGEGEPSALLVAEDATEVLRSQRLEAWAEMARMIAHEVKNPLTPIRLSPDHMIEVLRRDPAGFDKVFERCTKNILMQVDELQEIVEEFSTYSRIPELTATEGNLVKAMQALAASYESASMAGVELHFETSCERLDVSFDARLLRRAVRNLLENALRAAGDGGEVVLQVEASEGRARIVVSDDGPGVSNEDLPRIFDPYFSTHDSGTGLGLPIARRVAEGHGGSIHARNREGGGLDVVITIPLS